MYNAKKFLMNGFCFLGFLVLLVLVIPFSPKAKNTPVRIVSWWGYLESETKRTELENLCDATIELTEIYDIHSYRDNLAISEYDVYIYPSSFIKEFPERFPLKDGPNLSDITHGYYPAIKKRYDRAELPTNTIFFQDAVNTFVYDKDVLPSINELTAEAILGLYKKGAVVLSAEPLQLDWIFRQEGKDRDQLWDTLFDNFQTDSLDRRTYLGQQSRIVFSSLGSSAMREDLVLGYMDSGELINPNLRWEQLRNPDGSRKNIAFGLHPSFSPITTDLMTVRGGNPAAECLAREIGSQPFLNWVTQENYYLSPFGDIPHTGKAGEELGREYLAHIDTIEWHGAKKGKLTFPSTHAYLLWSAMKDCRSEDYACDSWLGLAADVNTLIAQARDNSATVSSAVIAPNLITAPHLITAPN